jgi:hypothetical protein
MAAPSGSLEFHSTPRPENTLRQRAAVMEATEDILYGSVRVRTVDSAALSRMRY